MKYGKRPSFGMWSKHSKAKDPKPGQYKAVNDDFDPNDDEYYFEPHERAERDAFSTELVGDQGTRDESDNKSQSLANAQLILERMTKLIEQSKSENAMLLETRMKHEKRKQDLLEKQKREREAREQTKKREEDNDERSKYSFLFSDDASEGNSSHGATENTTGDIILDKRGQSYEAFDDPPAILPMAEEEKEDADADAVEEDSGVEEDSTSISSDSSKEESSEQSSDFTETQKERSGIEGIFDDIFDILPSQEDRIQSTNQGMRKSSKFTTQPEPDAELQANPNSVLNHYESSPDESAQKPNQEVPGSSHGDQQPKLVGQSEENGQPSIYENSQGLPEEVRSNTANFRGSRHDLEDMEESARQDAVQKLRVRSSARSQKTNEAFEHEHETDSLLGERSSVSAYSHSESKSEDTESNGASLASESGEITELDESLQWLEALNTSEVNTGNDLRGVVQESALIMAKQDMVDDRHDDLKGGDAEQGPTNLIVDTKAASEVEDRHEKKGSTMVIAEAETEDKALSIANGESPPKDTNSPTCEGFLPGDNLAVANTMTPVTNAPRVTEQRAAPEQAIEKVRRFPKPMIASWARMKRVRKLEKSKQSQESPVKNLVSATATEPQASSTSVQEKVDQQGLKMKKIVKTIALPETRGIGRVKLRSKNNGALAGIGEVVSVARVKVRPQSSSLFVGPQNKIKATASQVAEKREHTITTGQPKTPGAESPESEIPDMSDMIWWSNEKEAVEIVAVKANEFAEAWHQQERESREEDKKRHAEAEESRKRQEVEKEQAREKKASSRRERRAKKEQNKRKKSKRRVRPLVTNSSDEIDQWGCRDVVDTLGDDFSTEDPESTGCRDIIADELKDMAKELVRKGPMAVVSWLE